ncbi:MAG: hypothetical protein QXV17_14000 [Candidatus Micrarchaeaceae archaeon]
MKYKFYEILKKKHKAYHFYEDENHNVFFDISVPDAIHGHWLITIKRGLQHELKHRLRFCTIKIVHNKDQCEMVLIYQVLRNGVHIKDQLLDNQDNEDDVDEVLK